MFGIVEKAVALRATPLFATLPASDLLPVANLCTEVDLDGGDVLFREGDLGDAIYVVVAGKVAVIRADEAVATLGTGECVGEMAALDWLPRSATVTALEPTVLLRLDRHDMLDLLLDRLVLAEKLAEVMATRVRNSHQV